MEIGKCPFCGGQTIQLAKLDDSWALHHYCNTPKLSVCISVYGDTEENALENWNKRGDNDNKG